MFNTSDLLAIYFLAAKLSKVRNYSDWGPVYLVASFLLSRTPIRGKITRTRWILAQYGFTALVQRVSNCRRLQNIILTTDKVLNVLMYGLWITTRIKSSITLENTWSGRNILTANDGWIVILVRYCFTKLVQRMFNWQNNIHLTQDKLLDMLTCESHFCVIIHMSYKLLKWSVFMAHPVYRLLLSTKEIV